MTTLVRPVRPPAAMPAAQAQELEDPTPPTGDVYAPPLWPLMATLSVGGITFLLSRRKHREEP